MGDNKGSLDGTISPSLHSRDEVGLISSEENHAGFPINIQWPWSLESRFDAPRTTHGD